MESTLKTTLTSIITSLKNKINTALSAKVAVSDIIDNVTTTATDKPLSANMGKSLNDRIDNLASRGRFLSLWNCPTGLPETDPIANETYEYATGDYFIVKSVAAEGGTNYKPTGTSYTPGIASTVVETETVSIDDIYYYDGALWRLLINSVRTTTFVNIAGDPMDNSELAADLNAKQDSLSTAQLAATNSGATADIISDVVLKSTAQEISTTKTFTGSAKVGFKPQDDTNIDVSAVADTYSDTLALKSGNTTGTVPGATELDIFYNYTTGRKIVLPATDGDIELGRTDRRFKQLFVSGALRDGDTAGTHSVTVEQLTTHIADTDIHVTSTDKTAWNNKQDKLTFSTYGEGHALGSASDIYSLGVATGSGITLTDYGQSVQIGTDTSVLATASALTAETNRATGVESGLQSTITAMGTAINNKQDKLTAGRNITIESNTINAFSSNVTEYTSTETFKAIENIELRGASAVSGYVEVTKPDTSSTQTDAVIGNSANSTSSQFINFRNNNTVNLQSQSSSLDSIININTSAGGSSSATNAATINIEATSTTGGDATINLTADDGVYINDVNVVTELEGKSSIAPSSTTSSTLRADRFNLKSSVSSAITLSLTSYTSGTYPEYNGQFTITSGGSITFPSGVVMVGDVTVSGSTYSVSTTGTYQYSICNGYGVCIKMA